jgi:hypothetical protein
MEDVEMNNYSKLYCKVKSLLKINFRGEQVRTVSVWFD